MKNITRRRRINGTIHMKILWGKSKIKTPHYCIIIHGANTQELYKALDLTASQLSAQSSQMLTGDLRFSPAFLYALQAPISLHCSLWMICLLPSGKASLQNYTILKDESFTACMSFLHEKTHATDSTLSLNINLHWVFLRIDMHELLMRESSVH